MLGPEAILPEQARKELPAGVATGLAWTETGGDVLYIEAALLPDGKELTITGPTGRGDAGIGQDGSQLSVEPRGRVRIRSEAVPARTVCTSTCRPAPSRRMDRRRA